MRKSLMAVSAAAAIGAASLAAPSPAEAHAWWVVPAIVGGVFVAGAAAAAASQPHVYDPAPTYYRGDYYRGATYYRGDVSVRPSCQIVRERVPGGWRRYEVCR